MQAVQPASVGCMVYKRGLYSLHTWAINLSPLKLDYQATIIGFIMCVAENTLRGAENGEAPSVTETASRFRGSGTIGAPERARES